MIITNPPYTRPLSRPDRALRANSADVAVARNRLGFHQASLHIQTCTDIVSIGRLRWSEGTTMSGKQNFVWYRSNARHSAGPRFHAHGSAPALSRVSLCAQCGKAYRPQGSDSRFVLGHLSAARPSRTACRDTGVTEASGLRQHRTATGHIARPSRCVGCGVHVRPVLGVKPTCHGHGSDRRD